MTLCECGYELSGCRRCQNDRRRSGVKPDPNAVDLKPMLAAKAKVRKELLDGGGVGTELKKSLKAIGIDEVESCKCSALAAQMNEWGPEGCLANLPQIVSGVRENAVKMKLDAKIKKEWPELWERFDEVVIGLVKDSIDKTIQGGGQPTIPMDSV